MLDKFVKNTAREVSIDYIQKVVCDYFDIPIELMKSKTRKREIVQARQLAMYFSKQLTKNSLANIGLHCGNKDHATVLHACKTVNNLIDTDKQFRGYVSDIEKKLTNSTIALRQELKRNLVPIFCINVSKDESTKLQSIPQTH